MQASHLAFSGIECSHNMRNVHDEIEKRVKAFVTTH